MSIDSLTPEQPNHAPTTAPKKKKKWPWVVAGIVALFLIIGIASGGNKETVATTTQTTEQAQPAAPAEPAKPAEPEATPAQKNALKKAESYLQFTAFSKAGLTDQLAFDKFAPEDAAWAVENVKADWNEQAAKKAASYLKFTSFSHEGLVDQLAFDGFTPEQAEYGVSTTGL